MTEIEQKALALVNEVAADDAPWTLDDVKGGVVWKALCRAIEAQAREIERLRDAMKGPLAWLERWAVHVGNCETNPECTCGLMFVQHELRAALEGTIHD